MTTQTISLTATALHKLITEEAVTVETSKIGDEEHVLRLEPPAWDRPAAQMTHLLATIIDHAEYKGVKPMTIAHRCTDLLKREFHREGLNKNYDSLVEWLRTQDSLTSELLDTD
jgi:hypothetical protein